MVHYGALRRIMVCYSVLWHIMRHYGTIAFDFIHLFVDYTADVFCVHALWLSPIACFFVCLFIKKKSHSMYTGLIWCIINKYYYLNIVETQFTSCVTFSIYLLNIHSMYTGFNTLYYELNILFIHLINPEYMLVTISICLLIEKVTCVHALWLLSFHFVCQNDVVAYDEIESKFPLHLSKQASYRLRSDPTSSYKMLQPVLFHMPERRWFRRQNQIKILVRYVLMRQLSSSYEATISFWQMKQQCVFDFLSQSFLCIGIVIHHCCGI